MFANGSWELFAERLHLVKLHKDDDLDASYFVELFILIISNGLTFAGKWSIMGLSWLFVF